MSEEIIEKTFQVTTPARLIISNVRGSITIQPGADGIIEVKAFKHSNFESLSNVVEMAQDSDGTVRVDTRSYESFFGLLSHPPKVEYSVRVPQGIHLEASGVSSSLNVKDLSGSFKLKTISGDIDIANLAGPIKLNAVSGDISGSHLSGVLELETVSGRAKLLQSEFPSADASTVSGDMILQTPIAAGPYNFGSVSSSVRMLVPPDTHCTAELNSVSGSIRSSLPASTTRMGHGMRVTQVGNGGTAVRLKSVSGSLTFEVEGIPAASVPVSAVPAGSASTTPPAPSTTPSAPPLSTAEILEHIERGEMTVDEAIKLMKGQS